MYTRKNGEQQADIRSGCIDNFSGLDPWNMLTERGRGIIFALILKNLVRKRDCIDLS